MGEDEDNSKRPRGPIEKGLNYSGLLLLFFSSGFIFAPDIFVPLLGNFFFSDDPAIGGVFFFLCVGFVYPIFIFSIILLLANNANQKTD